MYKYIIYVNSVNNYDFSTIKKSKRPDICIMQSGSKIFVLMTTRSHDWLLVPFCFWCKNKKDIPAATSMSKNTLERISQHG